ncbi:DUF262 domain-containing protein [Flavobacterium algicola]|uniref:DUF262 domain-containing protein n=1 Tax=Flavobacterium algicola TaxID=556529 RepID=UPI001EFDCDA8|nr:DUF262 domain-containing protein [Flavobacterium algicola]MCG9792123.1 DUF262 domain-containing protein [Flavobacterium algicola]
MAEVKVLNINYKDFIQKYQNIQIPDYQRPYRWNKEKVKELLEDLREFFIDKPEPDLDYYIGGILLYNNKQEDCYEIIDGQQRLTTLNLISYVLTDSIQQGQNFHYNNHISFYHIKENYQFLTEQIELLQLLQKNNFFKKLVFTLILSNEEDQSFAFFDSQNNRGVSLAADDYLKAYHLREIESETLQSKLAEQWEHAAIKAQNEKNIEKGLLHLFYKILYRSRQWKGQSNIIPENKDQILSSFQKKTIKSTNNSYRLFKAKDNVKFTEVVISEEDTVNLIAYTETHFEDVCNLPFTIRQPLYKGLNFFQFTQKYYAIHQLLFYKTHIEDSGIQKVRVFYSEIYNSNMSEYLRHYIQLCLVMYYDTFGSLEIDKAVQYFDYFIGSIRIEKYYVRQEAIKNSLLQSDNNLLDVIAHSYLPEEVFDFISRQNQVKTIYKNENLKADNGVRDNYKNRVISYYGLKEYKLTKRIQWIK